MISYRRTVAIIIENDEFCSKEDGFCSKNDGFCSKNDAFNGNGQGDHQSPLRPDRSARPGLVMHAGA